LLEAVGDQRAIVLPVRNTVAIHVQLDPTQTIAQALRTDVLTGQPPPLPAAPIAED